MYLARCIYNIPHIIEEKQKGVYNIIWSGEIRTQE